MKRKGISIETAYQQYKKTYLDNVDMVMQTRGITTGNKLLENMDTFEEFKANVGNYGADYRRLHPNSHGESLDRLSKWTANSQTRLRSAKQARNIVARAKAAGYEGKITMNDIYYGTARADAFWEWYDTMDGGEYFWGS